MEINFIPAHSKRVARVLLATMTDHNDEAVKDAAADEAERSMFDGCAVDTEARSRGKQDDRSFDSEFSRHQAEMRIINQPRPPSADTSGLKLTDGTCQCCAKSFRTLRAKEFCSDK
jgi:hypothetical protein